MPYYDRSGFELLRVEQCTVAGSYSDISCTAGVESEDRARISRDLEEEFSGLLERLGRWEWYPVVQLGVGYRF